MEYTFYLPNIDGTEYQGTLNNNSLIIIGANGAGKSHLGAWIENRDLAQTHRIGAQRSLDFGDYIQQKSYEQSTNLLLYGKDKPEHNHNGRWTFIEGTDLNIQVTNVLGNNTTAGIGGAIYVGILSALYKKNLKAGLAVIGNVTIGGAVERVVQFADKVSSLADNGAKMVIVPMDNISELATIPTTVLSKCDVLFYNNAQVLLQKAME